MGTFVDAERRFLYVETPKAACTSIKHFLRDIRGDQPVRPRWGTRQSRLDMLVHVRGDNPLRSLPSFSGDEIQDITRGPGWFRFCVTRNPIERFFAAWRDKIFLCEPDSASLRFLPSGGRKFVEFQDFFAKVMAEDDPFSCDPHWRSQAALLLPEDVQYTRIYDVSELGALRDDLALHFRRQGRDEPLPELKRYNEGYKIPAAGFITPGVAEGLRRFYECDFAYFSFPEFEAPEAPQASSAALTSELTNAIFDRNRMIAACEAAYETERAECETRLQELRDAAHEQSTELQRLAVERQLLADAAEQRLTEIDELTKRYDPQRMSWKNVMLLLTTFICDKFTRWRRRATAFRTSPDERK
jgi:hypothetical protein